jgi:hypothetical protein
MARVTRELSQAWVKEAILVLDGAAPSRHFWSRWMDRALAPHATQMTQRPAPIPANDVPPEVEDEEDALRSGEAGEPGPPMLRFD